MFKLSRLLFALGPVAFSLAFSQSLPSQVQSADSLDTPLKKKVVDFGPSPYSPGGNLRVKLSCYFYPTFMVKEYDEGQKGADWLAIVPVEKNGTPECTQSHAPGERVVKFPEWSGYFQGAKGNLVFINADDGTDGGLPFVVYDSRTGKQIFQDNAYVSAMWTKKPADSPFNKMRVSGAETQVVSLKYLRVVEAECDLHTEKAACWERVRTQLGLKSVEIPVCSGYENIRDRWVSSVAYPVEVVLFPQPAIKTIVGPVRCWPVD